MSVYGTDYFSTKKLTIGLDYDGTITADPNLWSGFIKLCKARGHTIKIVTGDIPRKLLALASGGIGRGI